MGQMPDPIETMSGPGAAEATLPIGAPQASRWTLARAAQVALAVVAALALVGLLYAIGLQVAATQPGSTPARVVSAQAGPYPLSISLYKDPADAGYAMPFAIAPSQPVPGRLTYTVSSIPGPALSQGRHATPVNASFGPDPRVPNGVRGTVEITVQGDWFLHIVVTGPGAAGAVSIPISAKPAVVIPLWVAWPIGLLPAIGVALFIFAQRRRGAGAPPHAQQATD
jgi:hypothetical protein